MLTTLRFVVVLTFFSVIFNFFTFSIVSMLWFTIIKRNISKLHTCEMWPPPSDPSVQGLPQALLPDLSPASQLGPLGPPQSPASWS